MITEQVKLGMFLRFLRDEIKYLDDKDYTCISLQDTVDAAKMILGGENNFIVGRYTFTILDDCDYDYNFEVIDRKMFVTLKRSYWNTFLINGGDDNV